MFVTHTRTLQAHAKTNSEKINFSNRLHEAINAEYKGAGLITHYAGDKINITVNVTTENPSGTHNLLDAIIDVVSEIENA